MAVGAKEHPLEGELDRIFLSPDGTRFGTVTLRARKLVVTVDGRSGGGFDHVEPPGFSLDGRHHAYAARDGSSWSVIVGDRVFGPYGDAGSPVFSRDGRRVSFGNRSGRELRWTTLALP